MKEISQIYSGMQREERRHKLSLNSRANRCNLQKSRWRTHHSNSLSRRSKKRRRGGQQHSTTCLDWNDDSYIWFWTSRIDSAAEIRSSCTWNPFLSSSFWAASSAGPSASPHRRLPSAPPAWEHCIQDISSSVLPQWSFEPLPSWWRSSDRRARSSNRFYSPRTVCLNLSLILRVLGTTKFMEGLLFSWHWRMNLDQLLRKWLRKHRNGNTRVASI